MMFFKKIDFLMRRVYTPQHRFYFSPKSMEYILNKSGLKIKTKRKRNIDLNVIFQSYKVDFWARFFLTKFIIKFLAKLTTTHFEIVCEKVETIPEGIK